MKNIIKTRKISVDLEIDGGINFLNANEAKEAGANILVSGSTIFKENGGDFFFKDPRTSADIAKPAVKSTLPFIDTHSRGGYLHMNTEEGSLLMFPGWLEHGVTQNLSNEDRIVISFNLKLIPKL